MSAATYVFPFWNPFKSTHRHNDRQRHKHAPACLRLLFSVWHRSSSSFSFSVDLAPLPFVIIAASISPAVVRVTGRGEKVIKGSESEGGDMSSLAELGVALMHPSAWFAFEAMNTHSCTNIHSTRKLCVTGCFSKKVLQCLPLLLLVIYSNYFPSTNYKCFFFSVWLLFPVPALLPLCS